MNDFNERVANLSAEKRALLEAHLKGGEGIAERAYTSPARIRSSAPLLRAAAHVVHGAGQNHE